MSSGLILKMNGGYNGMSRVLEKFAKWNGEYSCIPYLKGRWPFIDREAVG
jgi:hypothetical protein